MLDMQFYMLVPWLDVLSLHSVWMKVKRLSTMQFSAAGSRSLKHCSLPVQRQRPKRYMAMTLNHAIPSCWHTLEVQLSSTD